MKISLHFLVLAPLLVLGCAASPASEEDVDSSEEAIVIKKGPGHTVDCRSVDVPMNAQTFTSSMSADNRLVWPGVDAYTTYDHDNDFWFSVPPRDGDLCDEACAEEVIARAAKRTGKYKGKLRGRLRVERKEEVAPKFGGGCAKYLTESVTLDFKTAVKGIHPALEETYDFLVMQNEPLRVELGNTPCP